MFERNDTLSQEERKLYTGRLLKLHQIIADNHENTHYRHQLWVYTGNTTSKQTHCGTAACAMGHAMIFADQFEGFDPNIYMRGSYSWEWPDNDEMMKASAYFGPQAFEHIFSWNAFGEGRVFDITREEALERIETHITEYLGCKLIEEKIDGAAT